MKRGTAYPTPLEMLGETLGHATAETLISLLKANGFIIVREEEVRLAPFEPLSLPWALPVDVLDV